MLSIFKTFFLAAVFSWFMAAYYWIKFAYLLGNEQEKSGGDIWLLSRRFSILMPNLNPECHRKRVRALSWVFMFLLFLALGMLTLYLSKQIASS
jgi:hypothetical protein